LDGVDLALCSFSQSIDQWNWQVKKAVTIPYPPALLQKLAKVVNSSALEITELDFELGHFFADNIIAFMQDRDEKLFCIASHGHTVFHQPEKGFTLQIGNEVVIAVKTNIPVVCDFRVLDVVLGGQGAPLVPIGDQLLFAEYSACVNLGGFSNISYQSDCQRIAFDIAPCNLPLNRLAALINLSYDRDGLMARNHSWNAHLLDQLNKLPYYQQSYPKSLGVEWLDQIFMPLIADADLSVETKISTVTEHIASQIAHQLNRIAGGTVLLTGGGTKNAFLVERIQNLTDKTIIIPDSETIDYKEALIFAFLGLLKLLCEDNCLRSVTGAERDSSGGVVWFP
jgi:anhydro-N-acetylmuramic acid kinase